MTTRNRRDEGHNITSSGTAYGRTPRSLSGHYGRARDNRNDNRNTGALALVGGVLGAGAEACIVEHQLAAGEHAAFANQRIELLLADDARLTHVRLQDDATGGSSVLHSHATLASRARYHRVDLELGAAEFDDLAAGDAFFEPGVDVLHLALGETFQAL